MPHCRIGLFVTIALGLLVAPRAADAQPVGKVVRIGYLAPGYRDDKHRDTQGVQRWASTSRMD